jgi:hypothetical protein
MNERVKILWSEAAESTIGDSWEEQTKFLEKFAELIVRECADIALTDGQATGNFEVFNKITKHFGVEE